MADLDLAHAQALEDRYDPEIQFRPLGKAAAWVAGTGLVCLALFHYWVGGFGIIRDQMLVGVHLSFVLGLVFIVRSAYRGAGSKPSWLNPAGVPLYDWVLAFVTPLAMMYLPLLPLQEVAMRVGNPDPIDTVLGTVVILITLETTRRSMGPALPIISVIFILYGVFGQYAPGVLKHPGASWDGLVNHIYLTGQGIYGVAATVVARYVFLFVVFGTLATRVGLGKLFIDLASLIAGRYSGGPAKVSVFASAMFGMISGSSVANAVTVGSLTIPAMKRIGYQPHFAAAVEATASTGGQITPPIMGAAAFIMAEFLGIPYRDIVIAAAIPASMHYLGVLTMVHLEAKKTGLRGLSKEELPILVEIFRENWMALFPLAVLLYFILSGYTPDYAAAMSITTCVVVGFLKRRNRLTVRDLVDSLRRGAQYALAVGAAAACVGIVIGVVTLTGMAFRLSYTVTQFAGDLAGWIAPLSMGLFSVHGAAVFLTLVFTAIACIIMGCGIPTTANYIIMVTVAAPTLALLGIAPFLTHMFVFYYGVLADVTPPVALAAYAAAGIAGANPFHAGVTAFRLATAKVMVPFVFVYSPSMLLILPGFTWYDFAVTMAGCIIGIFMIGATQIGWVYRRINPLERVVLGFGALWVIAPTLESTVAGLVIASPVLIRQVLLFLRDRNKAASQPA